MEARHRVGMASARTGLDELSITTKFLFLLMPEFRRLARANALCRGIFSIVYDGRSGLADQPRICLGSEI
jgi:hypothetical protein